MIPNPVRELPVTLTAFRIWSICEWSNNWKLKV